MTNRACAILLTAIVTCGVASPAFAQAKPKPKPAPVRPPSREVSIHGYAMVGRITFTAADSFDAVLGDSSGTIFGGGARIGLPYGGLFVDVGAWRFSGDGERVFVSGGEVVPLNIPMEVTITPVEISAGWQFRIRQAPRVTPYVAGGITSYGYRETSDFAATTDDVDDRFTGYHLMGGATVRLTRWLGVGGEFAWTTVPDAIGSGGVSDAFNEDDLGGTSLRLKLMVGR
jgi:opacity protein-like surface antigen